MYNLIIFLLALLEPMFFATVFLIYQNREKQLTNKLPIYNSDYFLQYSIKHTTLHGFCHFANMHSHEHSRKPLYLKNVTEILKNKHINCEKLGMDTLNEYLTKIIEWEKDEEKNKNLKKI